MTYRVSVYEIAKPARRRFVSRIPDMNERQAAEFMGYNVKRHNHRFLCVIAEERSVGQEVA